MVGFKDTSIDFTFPEAINLEYTMQDFLEDYIDTDDLKDYVYDYYYDDINENPESYLSEEDRELSDAQEEQISVKQRTIGKLQNQIDSLEERMEEVMVNRGGSRLGGSVSTDWNP